MRLARRVIVAERISRLVEARYPRLGQYVLRAGQARVDDADGVVVQRFPGQGQPGWSVSFSVVVDTEDVHDSLLVGPVDDADESLHCGDPVAPGGQTDRTASPPRGDGAEPESSGPWLYLVVMLEFQSTVDHLMPLRIRNYVDNFHMEQWRGRRFRSTDRLAPVLPIVLYIGKLRWTAARRVIDLVTPGATQAGGEEGNETWRADPRFAGDGYVLLDSHRVGREDSRHDNAAALLAGLENPSPSTLPELVGAVCRRLRAPELRELKEIMLEWAAWRARQAGLTIEEEDMAQVNRMENPDDVEAFYRTRAQVWEEERRAEGRVEGRVEGRAEGRVMGQRESMRRQAAMKFDAETAARLGAVLEGVTNQEAFDGVLAALVECDTPSDLLARAAEARRRSNGRNAPAGC